MGETVAPFVSATPVATALVVLFGVFGLTVLLEMGSEAASLNLAHRMQSGVDISDREIQLHDLRALIVTAIRGLVFLITAIVYLMWIHRAYRNLPALGATGLKYSPRSAVLWWFCPLANLVVPFQIVRETWQASDLASYQSPEGWQKAPTSILLGFWWGGWIASNFAGRAIDRMAARIETPDGFAAVTIASIGYCALLLVTALLAALVVRRIDRLQRRGDPAETFATHYAQ
jgi:hypothetical protein